MYKAHLVSFSVLLISLSAMAQNPAGPRGGTEPPLATPPKATSTPSPQMPQELPPAKKDGKTELAPSSSPATPTASEAVAVPESNKNAPHRFGFFGALTIPHVINYGLDYRHSSQSWGASIATGGYSLDLDDVSADLSNYEISGRYFPWNGSFFAGLAFGNHIVKAEKTEVIQGQNVTIKAKVDANYVTPQIGWHWSTDWGLTWGFEIGAVASLGADAKVEEGSNNPLITNDPEYIQNKKDAEALAKDFGDKTLPYLTLLRLGYQF